MVYSYFYMSYTFLTAQEIAQTLKLNIMTIYEYIRSGRLKAVKFGRYYRVLFEDFQKFVEEQRLS